MRRMTAICFLLLLMAWSSQQLARAQDDSQNASENPGRTEEKAKSEKPARTDSVKETRKMPVEAYRLDFSLDEMEMGKKVNTRRYSMNLTTGSSDEIKIGSRVPISTSPPRRDPAQDVLVNSQYQFMDIDTNIWAALSYRDEGLQLSVRSQSSDIASSGDAQNPAVKAVSWQPVIRHVQINGSTILVVGKPMLIGSVDDPNSNRQFQLEVTATKLR